MHGEGCNQIPRTEGKSRPRHKGAAKPALDFRLGPTVYEVCSFRLKNRSVTSVTVQTAFLGGRSIIPRRLGDGGKRQLSRPRGRNCFPRRNEPSRTDCRSLRPSYTARHWVGSTKTHRPKEVKRTAREAANYHAPHEIAVHATRGSGGGRGLAAGTHGL
jgi:hypothetical protein